MMAATAAPMPAQRARLRRSRRYLRAVGLQCLSPILLFALWEASARMGLLSPYLLPAFSDVIATVYADVVHGDALMQAGLTLYRALAGFAVAACIGVPVGILMARIPAARWLLEPFVSIGLPIPKIAFLPIFVLWFGLFDASKIIMVAFTSIFPIIALTQAGIVGLERWPQWSARSLGASEAEVVREIVIPLALPSIFTALQIAAPSALITAVVAEMLTGSDGLGGAMLQAGRFANSLGVFAGIVEIAVVGALVISGLEAARRRLLRWHAEARRV